MNEQVKEDALATLDRMDAIVRNDAIVRGNYVVRGNERPEAPCGGHKFCAIGSLWWAEGNASFRRGLPGSALSDYHLRGVHEGHRQAYMQDKPHLKLAYDTLNDVARSKAEGLAGDLGERISEAWESPLEGLFEGGYLGTDDLGDGPGFEALHEVIAEARGRIERA